VQADRGPSDPDPTNATAMKPIFAERARAMVDFDDLVTRVRQDAGLLLQLA
jgi:hypothetical protein